MAEQCLICGSGDLSTEAFQPPRTDSMLHMYVCGACGYARRIGARASQEPEFQAEHFDKVTRAPTAKARRVFWPKRRALVARRMRRLLGTNSGRALDIGCGKGGWLCALGDGWEKHGLDVSEVAAQFAREAAGAAVHVGPLETYDVRPCFFDLITAFALIEHLDDPWYLVRWSYEHLRPGGLFVVMTGDRESKEARRRGQGWAMYRPLVHVSFFSARALNIMLVRTGFEIRRREWTAGSLDRSKASAAWHRLRDVLDWTGKPDGWYLCVYAARPASAAAGAD